METKEPIGQVETREGTIDVLSMFRTTRDDREVTLMRFADGSIGIVTESWLKVNERTKVVTSQRFSEGTLAMMLQTVLLGAEYIGMDVKKSLQDVSIGDRIEYEYCGNGEFVFRDSFNEVKDGEKEEV